MPNIPTYRAPDVRLNAADRGYQAFETAGRRVGPLLNQAASDEREQGALIARGIRNRIWPFDILALYERRRAEEDDAPDSGSGFQVRGGSGGGLALQGGNGFAGSAGGGGVAAASRAGSGAASFARMAHKLAGGSNEYETGRSDSYYRADGEEVVGEVRYGPVRPLGPGPNAEAFERAKKWYDGVYEQQQNAPLGSWETDDQGKPMYLPSTVGRGAGKGTLDLTPYPAQSSTWGDMWGSLTDGGGLASEGREHIK